jgi:hypothetical protein
VTPLAPWPPGAGAPCSRAIDARRFARARFQRVAQRVGRVQRAARKEPRQHVASGVAERGLVDPGAFASHVALAAGEPRRRGAQDRPVDVDQQPRLGCLGRRVVAGGQDQRVHARGGRLQRAGAAQLVAGPVGAALLVVGAVRVVHRVVEPQRHLDLARMLGQRAVALEQDQAVRQVRARVVGAFGLTVRRQQLVPQRVARGRVQTGPAALPGPVQCVGTMRRGRHRRILRGPCA